MRYYLIALTLLFSIQLYAQSTYTITAHISGLKDSTCYLAHYTSLGSGQFFIQDTARADAQGNVIFTGNKKLPEGLYVVSIAKWRLFDVVIDADQNFELITDVASIQQGNPPRHMKVIGSKENELFYTFNEHMQQYVDQLSTISKDKTGQEQLREVQKKMSLYRNTFILEHAGSLTAMFLKAAFDPEIPPIPNLQNGKPDSTFAYRYYKKHYLDGIDFTDERMLRTPFLQQKIDTYFNNLVYQLPDSIITEADQLMSRTKGHDMRRYVAYRITSKYEQSKVVGVDGVFVHMGEKYYIGEPALWDTSTVTNFKKRIETLKPLLVGKQIPNMYQTDTLGYNLNLYDVKANYTILFIYSDECGHCQEAVPLLKKFYEKYKNLGVKIYATDMLRNKTEWIKFIHEYKTQDFINVTDIHTDPATKQTVYYTDYLKTFDAVTTPTIYILDKDKKILARKIPAEELDKYFEFMLNRQAKSKS
ncbi:MAG: DUF5106 domain-containing protein [Siphonobacter sp.]